MTLAADSSFGVWPDKDLEYIAACPACGGTNRNVFLSGLSDLAFRAGEGSWTLWRCEACKALYLNPRPSKASIGRAYRGYYTQEDTKVIDFAWKASSPGIKARMQIGYINREFGYRFPGGLPFGSLAMRLSPGRKETFDLWLRHLPAPTASGAPLLDIGCGNGNFLFVARSLGFDAVGLDPDPVAIERAKRQGLRAFTGFMPETPFPDDHFEQVTLNHVMEHLHDPCEAMAEIFRVMKPDGRVWLSQPNPESIGLRLFGKDWRGLEAPRHICLYGVECLKQMLERAGFVGVRHLRPAPCAFGSFRASLLMRKGLNFRTDDLSAKEEKYWSAQARSADKAARKDPRQGENMTLVAWKP